MSMKMEQWIAAEHRHPDSIARYRRAIHDSSARAAILDDVLLPERLSALRGVFAGDGLFEPTFGLFNRHPHTATAEEFAAVPAQEQFYHYRTLVGPVPGKAMSPGMAHNASFTMLSRSAAWKEWLGAILGQPLAAQTGMHTRIMSHGMFMKTHNDDAHGALCAVLYLGAGWEPAFGGSFVQERRGERIVDVAPIANRLLLFSPDKGLAHGVTPFTKAIGDWERWSYSLWYGDLTEGADPH